MSRYHRAAVPEGSLFSTVITERHQLILINPAVRLALREAIVSVQQALPFKLMLGSAS
jgi:REP element-mobilizing transposase RayT